MRSASCDVLKSGLRYLFVIQVEETVLAFVVV